MRKATATCAFALVFLVARGAVAGDGEQVLRIQPADWDFSRGWKSAHGGSGGTARYHYYAGTFGLANVAEAPLSDLTVRIRTLGPRGRKIRETDPIPCGRLAPGDTVKREFAIEWATQFAELILEATFRRNGKEGRAEFSSTDGSCPQRIAVDKTGTVQDLRLLSYDIEVPLRGRHKGQGTLVLRVRNLSAVPARQPTASITFRVKQRRQRSKNDKDRGDRVVREVLLDEGEVAPGETKLYTKPIGRIGEYHGYSVSLSAGWPEPEVVVEEQAPVTFRQTRGEGDAIALGRLEATTTEDGLTQLSVPVTNRGETIQPQTFRLNLTLTDGDGAPVLRLTQRCDKALAKGQTVGVRFPAQELPAYAGYEVTWDFQEAEATP